MLYDFMAFWATARVFINGGNPYSPAEIAAALGAVDPSNATPIFMYYPPWALLFFLPFGWLDHETAQFLWFLLHTVIIFLGAQILWQHYSGSPTISRAGWVALLTFAPIYFLLLLGQIAPFVLVGVIGFLWAARNQSWFWAGAWIAIVSIKPHLLYLFLVALLLWILRDRKWQVAVGLIVTFVVLATVPALIDGQIYVRYFKLMSDRTVFLPMDWANPTIGTAINQLFGGDKIWLRWLPVLGGLVWLMWYRRQNAVRWEWSLDLPLVLLVSVVTTPYSWTYDYVVLLPALIQGVTWFSASNNRQRARLVCAVYLLSCATLLIGKIFVRNDFWYFWFAPTLLVLYLCLRKDGLGVGIAASASRSALVPPIQNPCRSPD